VLLHKYMGMSIVFIQGIKSEGASSFI
jgi:hypothetical protein